MEDLVRIGLTETEADIYLALLRGPDQGAQQLADALGVPRTRIYPALKSLTSKNLIHGGAGYGSRFRALNPEEGLSSLIARQREELHARESLAKELIDSLSEMAEAPDPSSADPVEILRDRRVIAERFDRLQLEAEHEVNGLVKAPILTAKRSNPTEEKILKRGVTVRAIYEQAVLEDEAVAPYLRHWVEVGEQARIYEGELPMKLQLFDAHTALLPLIAQGGAQTSMLLLVRDPSLGRGLRMFFDSLWDDSKPLAEMRH